MIAVIPAIDIRGGRCVRLVQGRADMETVYSGDPLAMALHWQEQGAKMLHVVDLDGAMQGKPVHSALIAAIAAAVSIPVQTGGGLRTEAQIAATLTAGLARAVIGTRACSSPEDLALLAARFGDRLAVGIDARGGFVQSHGWTETTRVRATDLARKADAAGVRVIVYTDTALDGMLGGVNASGVGEMCRAVSCSVVASGGITSAADIRALAGLERPNLTGAIVGKALYEKKVSLSELQMAGADRC